MNTIPTMQGCTEAYNNDCWVLTNSENRIMGVLRAKPFHDLKFRLENALASIYDLEDLKIDTPQPVGDDIHEVKVTDPTEEDPDETVTITPAWEY